MYDRDYGYSGVEVDMFGLFKKKEQEPQPPQTVYVVDFDKIETFEQLKEVVRGTVHSLSRGPIPRLRISEKGLEKFPALRDVVVEEKDVI
jgi:hypothetical protein